MMMSLLPQSQLRRLPLTSRPFMLLSGPGQWPLTWHKIMRVWVSGPGPRCDLQMPSDEFALSGT